MAIERWKPTKQLSPKEKVLLERCQKKRRLFAFLREHRLELFDDALQRELEGMYRSTGASTS